jgi:hypothetical protein
MMIDIAGFTKQEILELLLAGLEVQKREVVARIAEIRIQLGSRDGHPPKSVPEPPKPAKRHHLSAAARENIRLAQKKRWKAFHRVRARADAALKAPKAAKPAKKALRKRVPPPIPAEETSAVQ